MHVTRSIRWSALTCRLNETDVYLGLAARIDDVVSSLVDARQMVAFPLVPIRMTSADRAPTPLRVYSVRDPRIVEIDRTPSATSREVEAGFRRVTIELRLDRTASRSGSPECSAIEAKANVVTPAVPQDGDARPVMAFLMTVGLAEHEEDSFFSNVVGEFLSKSWMTVPTLLRELGCSTAEHVAEGGSDACSCG